MSAQPPPVGSETLVCWTGPPRAIECQFGNHRGSLVFEHTPQHGFVWRSGPWRLRLVAAGTHSRLMVYRRRRWGARPPLVGTLDARLRLPGEDILSLPDQYAEIDAALARCGALSEFRETVWKHLYAIGTCDPLQLGPDIHVKRVPTVAGLHFVLEVHGSKDALHLEAERWSAHWTIRYHSAHPDAPDYIGNPQPRQVAWAKFQEWLHDPDSVRARGFMSQAASEGKLAARISRGGQAAGEAQECQLESKAPRQPGSSGEIRLEPPAEADSSGLRRWGQTTELLVPYLAWLELAPGDTIRLGDYRVTLVSEISEISKESAVELTHRTRGEIFPSVHEFVSACAETWVDRSRWKLAPETVLQGFLCEVSMRRLLCAVKVLAVVRDHAQRALEPPYPREVEKEWTSALETGARIGLSLDRQKEIRLQLADQLALLHSNLGTLLDDLHSSGAGDTSNLLRLSGDGQRSCLMTCTLAAAVRATTCV